MPSWCAVFQPWSSMDSRSTKTTRSFLSAAWALDTARLDANRHSAARDSREDANRVRRKGFSSGWDDA